MSSPLEVYRAWAPEASPWAPWVKPVMFAHLPAPVIDTPNPAPSLPDFSWVRHEAGTALLLEFPGATCVRLGLDLAQSGKYWPVPTFASAPPDFHFQSAMVPTAEVLRLLAEGAEQLRAITPNREQAPIFLVDANRIATGAARLVDTFDNRSALFASDFPSAAKLQSLGIHRCIVIREHLGSPGEDLLHALLPWRAAGIRIEVRYEGGSIGADFRWPGTGFLSGIFYRIGVLLSLRRNPKGGFGRFVPESSGG